MPPGGEMGGRGEGKVEGTFAGIHIMLNGLSFTF